MMYQFCPASPKQAMPTRFTPSPNPPRSALPIYIQVSELIVREITAGRLMDGEKLPPERQMAKDLGVAIGTLRKALADLQDKGFLERIQGSGNYVRAGGTGQPVYAMFRLELPDGGGLPKARVVSVDEMAKPADLPDFGVSDRATRVRRLRLLNDTPAAVEEIWLCRAQGAIDAAGLGESLYHYYRTALGFWITRAEDRVWLAPAPDWTPDSFPRRAGETLGFVERWSWADPGPPVEYSRTWFDPNAARYVQRMK